MRGWLAMEYQAVVFEEAATPVAYALFRQTPEWIHLRQFFVARDCRSPFGPFRPCTSK